jgi:hypothetical protein
MFWAAVSAVAFVLATAIVIGLARTSTAQWEADKRAPRAPEREPAVAPEPAGGVAARLARIRERTLVAVASGRSLVRTGGEAGGRGLTRVRGMVTAGRRALARRHPIARLRRVRAALRPHTGSRPRPAPSAAQDAVQGDAVQGNDGAQPSRRRRRRITARLVHRHDRERSPRSPRVGPRG